MSDKDPLAAAKAWIEDMTDRDIIGHFKEPEATHELTALLVRFAKGKRGADAFNWGVQWALVEVQSKIGRITGPTDPKKTKTEAGDG